MILLVEPAFPIPNKSKNHSNFLPIGLLKIASYLRENGNEVRLVRGIQKSLKESDKDINFQPHEIWITSLFTYWAKYVKEAVQFYKSLFPKAKIIVGGIYASLLPINEVKEYTGCDEVYQGVMKEAEKHFPAYGLLANYNSHPIDYQIIHTTRGCKRKCSFCGTWKIEPQFIAEKSIKDKVKFRKIIFYDNNLLANPHIKNILNELAELKKQNKISWCESQSGLDGRILIKKPYLANMLKKAGFRYPRIAWDAGYKEYTKIEKQLNILKNAGYNSKDLYVFVLYNWDINFEEMQKKRIKCWQWGVQIADCRYRPLNQLYDEFNSRKVDQSSYNYYIHISKGWNDALIKQFRKNVRMQNICVRHRFPFYSKQFERKTFDKEIMKTVKELKTTEEKMRFLKDNEIDFWIPGLEKMGASAFETCLNRANPRGQALIRDIVAGEPCK